MALKSVKIVLLYGRRQGRSRRSLMTCSTFLPVGAGHADESSCADWPNGTAASLAAAAFPGALDCRGKPETLVLIAPVNMVFVTVCLEIFFDDSLGGGTISML